MMRASMPPNEKYTERPVYGPFYRIEAPKGQDVDAMIKQILSGELWGRRPSFGGDARAKAYNGSLPENASGFEFWAFTPPDNYQPQGPNYWRNPSTYVEVGVDDEGDVVKLRLAFVKVTQDLHP